MVLALATSIYYIFGVIYLSAYFERFSFPYSSLNLSTTIYIIPLIITVLVNIFSIIFLYETNRYTKNNSTYSSILILGLIWLILGSCIFFILKIFPVNFYTYIFLANFFYVYFSYRGVPLRVNIKEIFYFLFNLFNLKSSLKSANRNWTVLTILFILSFNMIATLFFTSSLANSYSSNLIEGRPGNYEVKLDLNNLNCSLPDNTFILVMQHEGCLYLVQKKVPAPKHSTLYVVPANKINYATINLIAPETEQVSIIGTFYNLTSSIWNLPDSIKPYFNNSSTRNNVS